jgi:branched-chain amino acid transport system ATP-binding protein
VLDNVLLGRVGTNRLAWLAPLLRPKQAAEELADHAARAYALLEEWAPDLAARCYRPARELTLVERRRLEICRALASDPDLLLLDEPSAGMDARETRELMEEIRRLRVRRPEIGIALIEHDMSVVRGLADRVVVLNYGRKIAEGTFDEVAASREVREAYLGT